MAELNSIFTVAYRDIIKFLRDRSRIIATFIFPIIFIGILGTSLQANLGGEAGYNLITFAFTGVIGQTLFQSTALGVISLIEDRESDFSQEIFVAPISRYSIIVGKILGESVVALIQVVGIIIFGLIVRVPISLPQLINLIPTALIVCLLGGAFGILVLSNLNNQRSANQLFPFILFPQFFLAGVFSPIKDLPWYLLALSRIAPMTYAVDFIRSVYYFGNPSYNKIVLFNPAINLIIISLMFAVFLAIGTFLFIRKERNR
jgi:ABC-2 type transport system permease protein